MEAAEEVMGPKDPTNIVKGKRTKRQRPHSPIPFTITAHSSSSSENNMINSNNHSSSPASSGEYVDSTTTEDEDTAKCLILLAQGRSWDQHTPPRKDKDEDYGGYKFNSKRYVERSTAGNGKAGMYVYECRTCNRTFPSFQALGGHRASHKKPKLTLVEKKPLIFSDDEEIPVKRNVSSFSLQLSNGGGLNNPKTPRIHECSICGTEFTSGQALGGHMRRHRTPVGTSNAHLSMNQMSPPSVDHSEEAKKTRNFLSLDLNLPAPEPEDDHHRDAKFAFTSKQQNQHQQDQQQKQQQQQTQEQKKQSALVLSTTPTLVDCHY